MTLALTRHPSLTEQAAQSIRDRIVRGLLLPGAPLSEIALAQELGVSKTPVREALIELKRQGLVEIHPQRGTFVFAMTAEEVRDLAEMRAVLEGAALRLATERDGDGLCHRWEPIVAAMQEAAAGDDAETYRGLDGDFHQAIVDAAGNRFLGEAFTAIAFRIQALRSRLSLAPALNAASLDEHVQLLEMVGNRRSKKAADLLLSHIERTRDLYTGFLAGTGEGANAAPRSVHGDATG